MDREGEDILSKELSVKQTSKKLPSKLESVIYILTTLPLLHMLISYSKAVSEVPKEAA